MRAGPIRLPIVATWPSGHPLTGGAALWVLTKCERQRFRGRDLRARLGREPHDDVARLAEGSTQSPTSMPANAGRSACATCPTVMPSAPARRDRSGPRARASALRREADVDRARHLLHSSFTAVASRPARVYPGPAAASESASAVEAAGADRRRDAAEPRQLARSSFETCSCWRSRSAFGTSRTKTEPSSTAPVRPPIVVYV